MKQKNLPELLLPVGSKDMLTAAVSNGADAVYFGVPGWNARGRTVDFSLEDVASMISYAHIHGVKVYLAMNVLIFQNELESLPDLLEKILLLKPDAWIIQDIGLARLIRAIAPQTEIHASTQMTISSAEGANFLKPLGFNRVVLARENSIRNIADIRQKTDLELEVFVHGALCVSYSGQCLTSENFGGRSGNRGQCAQSCRLPYRMFIDGKEISVKNTPFLFSPHDLSALPFLNELTEVEIQSYKIEGRLKSPEYIAAVTKAYRQKIDGLKISSAILDSTETLFSRGFCDGWLHGIRHRQLVDGSFSNHHGQKVGTIQKIQGRTVFVESKNPTHPISIYAGDGILFEPLGAGARLFGITVETKSRSLIYHLEFGIEARPILQKLKVGEKVFRNDSPTLEKKLKISYTERDADRIVPVSIKLIAKENKPLTYFVQDAKGHGVQISGKILSQKIQDSSVAQTHSPSPAFEAALEKEAAALSGTAYFAHSLKIEADDHIFVRSKEIRPMRRLAIHTLDTLRAGKSIQKIQNDFAEEFSKYKLEIQNVAFPDNSANIQSDLSPKEFFSNSECSNATFVDAQSGYRFLKQENFHTSTKTANSQSANIPKLSVLVRHPNQIEALQGLPIQTVYMDFDWGVPYEPSLQLVRDFGFETGIATLRIHKPGENHYFKKMAKLAPEHILVRNLAALAVLSETPLTLEGDYSLNISNSLAANYLLKAGLKTFHPSLDLNADELFSLLQAVDSSKIEIALHQYLPAFHADYCAFAAFGAKAERFPECKAFCTKHKVEILDHKGKKHFLQSDSECRNTLFLGAPRSALRLLPDLRQAGVQSFRLEMLNDSPQAVHDKVSCYAQALSGEISLSEAIQKIDAEEKYGVSEGQLFNSQIWKNRKKTI